MSRSDGGTRSIAESGELPVEQALLVDEACNAFEAKWRGGGKPDILAALFELPAALRAATLKELVLLDVFYRRENGEAPAVAEYADRFPELDSHWLAGVVSGGGDGATVTADGGRRPGAVVGAPGTRVGYFGDYELLVELARGGMGVVYKARQVTLDRLVALKMVRAGEFATEEEARRFRQEVEAVAALDHPNIVPIFEVGDHRGRQYYTMPLLSGSLAARASAYGVSGARNRTEARGRQARAARLVAAIARAVYHAHQRGILHRDLKPSNVLLDEGGEPHVADFGLARRLNSGAGLTATGAVLGTPSYMAPEQARGGKEVTTQTDVYGVGAVLYELLTGRPPFHGADVLSTLDQVKEREPMRPRAVCEFVDPDLETVCLKCLEKDPNRRYSGAAALADDLDRWLRGEPVLARRSGRLVRVRKWAQRNPAAAALAVVSAVAVLAAAGGTVALAYSRTLERKNWELVTAHRDAEIRRGEADAQRTEADRQRAEADTQRARAEEQEVLARRYLYAARLALADRAVRDGNTRAAVELLDRCRPDEGTTDLRGFEWYYLWTRVGGDEYAIRSARPLPALAVTPDGAAIAAAGTDGRVTVLDTRTGRTVRTFTVPGMPVLSVAFSRDGRLLAAAGGTTAGGFLRVWDYPSGAVRADTPDGVAIRAVALTADGERLALARADGSVVVRAVAGGPTVLETRGHKKAATGVAFSPDGAALASCGEDGMVRLWRPAVSPSAIWSGNAEEPAHAIAFSPDGGAVASASGRLLRESPMYGTRPGVVAIWDSATGTLRKRVDAHLGVAHAVAFSQDGTRLATGGEDRLVKVWETATLKEERTLHGFTAPVLAVAFDRTGARIVASGGSNRTRNPEGELRVWDLLPSGAPIRVKSQTYYNTATFSPNGHLIGGCADSAVRLWDANTGAEIRPLLGLKLNVYDLAFTRDGTRVVAAGQSCQVAVWETATGRLLHTLGSKDNLLRFAISPNGRTVATGAISETVRLFDTESGQQTGTLNLPGPLSGRRNGRSAVTLAYSPNGRLLAVAQAGGGEPSVVSVWEPESNRRVALLDGPSTTARL